MTRRQEQPDGRPTGPSSVIPAAFLCLVVFGATLLAHWPVLSAQATLFDDGQYLTENPLVQHPGWTSAGRFLREVTHPSTVTGYYQPLAMISLMLDYAVAGSAENLRPFHRTSLILHAANAVLVIVLVYMLLGQPWAAAMVGLLFGVHPMSVEPVAWIGERKTLLAAFFALWALITYVRYARRPTWRLYITCFVLFVMALLSKPSAMPLPVVMLVLDWWPLRRLSRKTVLEKSPFLLASAASAIVTVISQRHLELTAFRELSVGQTLLLICHNLTCYPAHMLWPAHLSSIYLFPEKLSLSSPVLRTSVLVSVASFVFLLISLRWTRALLAGGFCFFVLLAPTLFNKSYSPSVAWDKYAYLPALGLLLVLAWLLTRICSAGAGDVRRGRIRALNISGLTSQVWLLIVVSIAIASLLATGTRRLLRHWQTTEAMCNYMLDLAPNAALVYIHRGLVYYARGEYDRAIQDDTRAIELKPDHSDAYNNRGNALCSKGDYEQAIRDYTRAIELLPTHAQAHNNRAIAHFILKQYDQALADVRKCRQLGGTPTPDFVRALAQVTGRLE